MGLESPVNFIDDLDAANPTASDIVSQGDDHIRNIKTALLASFPNVDAAVNPSVAEFNRLVGVTEAIQPALDNANDALTAVQALDPKQQPSYSQNVTDTAHDIDFTVGNLLIGSQPVTTTAMTKQLDNVWAAGTNQGGRAAGNAAYTGFETVFLHVLGKTDGTADYGYDTNQDGSDLLADANVVAAGFTLARPIGVMRLDSSGNLLTFTLHRTGCGDFIKYQDSGVLVLNNAAVPTSGKLVDLNIPSGIWVEAYYSAAADGDSFGISFSVHNPTMVSGAGNGTRGLQHSIGPSAGDIVGFENRILINDSQIFLDASNTSTGTVRSYGYLFNRHEL